MTCKDCVHYVPCFSGGPSIWNNIEQTEDDHCRHFKTKADFVEVKHGEWKKYRVTEGHVFLCSLCGYGTLVDFEDEFLYHNYCPKCGADMRKEGADNGEIR